MNGPPRVWMPGSDDALAEMQPPTVALSDGDLDRIARLALMLTQAELRRNPSAQRFAAPAMAVPYEERPEAQRAASRTTVVRVLQALTMLGYIDVS